MIGRTLAFVIPIAAIWLTMLYLVANGIVGGNAADYDGLNAYNVTQLEWLEVYMQANHSQRDLTRKNGCTVNYYISDVDEITLEVQHLPGMDVFLLSETIVQKRKALDEYTVEGWEWLNIRTVVRKIEVDEQTDKTHKL